VQLTHNKSSMTHALITADIILSLTLAYIDNDRSTATT